MNNSLDQGKKQILFRPRVNALLGDAAEHALVTVTAGTGYGKSQAVASFIEREGLVNNVWLHLTGLDNYTTRFWDMFVQAVQTQDAALAKQMAAMGFPDTMEKIYRFLQSLAASVYERGRCILVLDDFHKIESPAIINFIEMLSFTNIENLSIILITRHPLMIDYSALQAQHLHANISARDLRFTPGEAQAYFEMAGLDFTAAVMQNIYNSTEGWPLALYLIGLHRRQQGALFNDPIECTIPLLYSLIEVEIYNGYSEEVQKIFAKLSLMESVPLEMVKVISGRAYADVLAHLRQNMFVQYNPQMEQYHFHRLFRLFLEEKQAQFTAEELGNTYLAIGDWYNENGNYIEALTFYQKCKNHAKLWDVIRRHCMVEQMSALCLGLLDGLPPEFLEANPECHVMRALLIMYAGDIELAHQNLLSVKDEYESLHLTPVRKRVLGEAYIVLAFTSLMKADYAFAEYYKKAYEYLPEGSSLIQQSQPYVGNDTAFSLFSNQPGEAEKMLRLLFEVMPYAARVMNGCGFGVEYLAAAELAFHQVDLQRAAEFSHQAIYHAQQKNQHDIVYNGFAILGRIRFAEGDYEGAFGYLQQIREYAGRIDRPQLYGTGDVAAGWFYAKVNRPELVESWISTSSPAMPGNSILLGREKIVQAYVLLLREEYYELAALLDYIEGQYQKRSLSFLLLQVYLLRTLCMCRLGNADALWESFLQAYEAAYHNNLIMYFLEFGGAMCEAIDAVRTRLEGAGLDNVWIEGVYWRASEYESRRVAVEKEFAAHAAANPKNLPQLADDEVRVLQALCRGLSRGEIAEGFGLGASMVKTMLKNIYVKLGAINRVDAIRIAKDSNLV